MKTSDFYYDLPEELIAQTPADPRDSSRLLVYHRDTKQIEHRIFRDIAEYFHAGDVLVVNRTRVLPARLFGETKNGGKAELLLLKRLCLDEWECLVKPGKKCRMGAEIRINDELSARVVGVTETGERHIRFVYEGAFEDVLSRAGTMPLPPYIHEKLNDPERYQTVYSRENGSAAAPTAGLHFTPELLQTLRDKGVEIVEVLLHVGLGTFRPVKVEDVENTSCTANITRCPRRRRRPSAAPSGRGGASYAWARRRFARSRRWRSPTAPSAPARATRASSSTRPIK